MSCLTSLRRLIQARRLPRPRCPLGRASPNSTHRSIFQFTIPAAADDGLPASVQLDSGALLIEFHSKQRREFQILTPQAIASVRGPKWAMEVKPGQTSTLVLLGQVTGQGVYVSSVAPGNTQLDGSAKPPPIAIKKWTPDRVKTLLAQFGQ